MAILELGADLIGTLNKINVLFWPAVLDVKIPDLESIEDSGLDVCFFNGAIRTSENEHMARLLRKKSKNLVAFGTCAYGGGIPALANTTDRAQIFNCVYEDNPTTDNPNHVTPQMRVEVKEGQLGLPEFYDTVNTLDQMVEVDYYVPGCPPVGEQVQAVLKDMIEGRLPPKGSVIGASEKSLCNECKRVKGERKIGKIIRGYQSIPDTDNCLLDQGIICMGPATRGGCKAVCLEANMPCRGCYGPPPNVSDQGAKMLSALSSMFDVSDEEQIERIASSVPDPIGTFYRYYLARSLLRRTRR
jgi:F420-non-reducing hydrogenase small subunit